MTENEPMAPGRQPSFLWTGVIVIGTAFAAGAVAGYRDAMRDAGEAISSSALPQVLVLLLGCLVLGFYLSRFGRFWKNWSRRKKLYTLSLIMAAALGFLSSIALRLGADGDAIDPFGKGPVDPTIALLLSALWIGGMGLSILIYQRNIDDHEKQAYLWGGLAGFYAVVFPAPAWWLLARAGMLPPVDGMILFLFSLVANAIVYFWLKFR
jgi:hypothetical protein